VARLRSNFTEESIRTARAIEHRLYEQSWLSADYDLIPRLGGVIAPTLVLHGDHDFVPAPTAARVAAALPHGRMCLLPGCGHFVFLESPDEVRSQIVALFGHG
jgi:pimeloyl-ACP methyl ester carboxylesterase